MKYLAIRLTMLAPIPLLAIVVSLSVDFADLLHTEREHESARLLKAGQHIAIDVDHIDQRRLQRYYVESLTEAPDWVVLGSSRAMSISHDMAAVDSFFNHAVFSAELEDFIGILGLYVSRGIFPKHVMVTIDPWIMNRLNGTPSWQSYRDAYDRLTQAAEISIDHAPSVFTSRSLAVTKASELLSLSYFQACLRQLLYEPGRRFGPPPPVVTDAGMGEQWKMLSDGSTLYPRSKYSVTAAQVSSQLRASPAGMVSTGAFSHLDGDLKVALSRLVTYLARRGVDVILVLMPFHPIEYERMIHWPGYSVATSVERYARTLAEEAHVGYVGSYDPSVAGCGESEFFDRVHAKPSCVAKVMQPLRMARRATNRSADE